jgi:hypothetical protein
MEKLQILSIARDPVLLQKLSRFINENAGWESTATIDDRAAVTLFNLRNFDMVLFFNNVEEESIKELSSVFLSKNPGLIIIQDVGDSAQILEDRINKAVQTKENATGQITSNE